MAAPKGNNFNPNGRPLKPINWETFEELCSIQCTQSEIANVLKIHFTTLIDRVVEHYGEDFASVYKMYADGGKSSLRRTQFKLSKKNAAMCIWLGKQYLGQKETLTDTYSNEEMNKRYMDVIGLLNALQSKERQGNVAM